jgi:hypothetical protein
MVPICTVRVLWGSLAIMSVTNSFSACYMLFLLYAFVNSILPVLTIVCALSGYAMFRHAQCYSPLVTPFVVVF